MSLGARWAGGEDVEPLPTPSETDETLPAFLKPLVETREVGEEEEADPTRPLADAPLAPALAAAVVAALAYVAEVAPEPNADAEPDDAEPDVGTELRNL